MFLLTVFLKMRQAGATHSCSAWLLLQRTGSRHMGFSRCSMWAQQLRPVGSPASVVAAHRLRHCGLSALEGDLSIVATGLSCSVACGIFLDQGSNWCSLRQQMDSQPQRHQGSPELLFVTQMALYNENILSSIFLTGGILIFKNILNIFFFFPLSSISEQPFFFHIQNFKFSYTTDYTEL